MEKTELKRVIADWIQLDAEIAELSKQVAIRKAEKKRLSSDLIETMKSNGIDCFSVSNSQIIYTRATIKKPVTKKILFSILAQYYGEDTDEATRVGTYIMENREDSVRETITRKASSDP